MRGNERRKGEEVTRGGKDRIENRRREIGGEEVRKRRRREEERRIGGNTKVRHTTDCSAITT